MSILTINYRGIKMQNIFIKIPLSEYEIKEVKEYLLNKNIEIRL